MSVHEELPEAVGIGEALYRVPRDPVDVFICDLGQGLMVFGPICDLAGSRGPALYAYLLERNAGSKVMPGAFAIYDGKVVYRMWVEPGELSQAVDRVLSTTQLYAPKVLPML